MGVLFLLMLAFLLVSGYIIPGRDPDIGAFQSAAIVVCAVAALIAFDFALLWPRHSFLGRRDWSLSMMLIMTGVAFLCILNILGELNSFQSHLNTLKYISAITVFVGLYWRFHFSVDAFAKNISSTIRKSLLPWISQVPNPKLYYMNQPKTKNLLLAILLVIALEFFSFRTYFTVNYQPYYARNSDQTVFLQAAYATYYSIHDTGLLNTINNIKALQPEFFKGPIVPNIAVIFMFLFGPNRLSAALVNFFFFFFAQMYLFFYFRKKIGFYAGLVATGLFYLSLTHYYWAGGMNDFRLDYAGMVVFGIAFISLIYLIETPSLKRFLFSSLFLGTALATRSITGIYLIVIIVFVNIFLFFDKKGKFIKQIGTEQLRYFNYLLIISAIISGIAFVLVGTESVAYYSHLFRGDERAIRAAEFGVLTLSDNFLYYPKSFSDHFKYYGYVLTGLMLLQAMKQVFYRARPNFKITFSKIQLMSYLIVFVITIFAVWVILLSYSQSPLVIGVLTIPIVFIATIMVSIQIEWLPDRIKFFVSVLVFITGLLFYAGNMITPRYLSPTAFVEAENVNYLYNDIVNILPNRNAKLTIFWLIRHDAINTPSFNVYLYEHNKRNVMPISSLGPGFFATTESDLVKQIEMSDVVVAPVYFKPSGGFEYPYTQSLRQYEGPLKKILNKDFILEEKYNFPSWLLGLYVRPCLILDSQIPNGIEDEPNPWFWLGDYPSEIYIENFSEQPLAAEFVAMGVNGPSNANLNKSALHYKINDSERDMFLSDTDGWDLTIPMILQPGTNILSLIGIDNVIINKNGDPRHLLLGIYDIKISCRKP